MTSMLSVSTLMEVITATVCLVSEEMEGMAPAMVAI